jgi:hypothetical protein
MAVPTAGPQQMGGAASSVAMSLATELVDHILGAEKRNREQEKATGLIMDDQQSKQALVDEVAAKITAVIPNPREAKAKEPAHASSK